jgi:hypothetical protein
MSLSRGSAVFLAIGLLLGAGLVYTLTLSSYVGRVTDIEIRTKALETQIPFLQLDYLSLRIKELIAANEAQATRLTILETQAAKFSPRSGYARITLYGFSFEYPQTMGMSVTGDAGLAATAQSGKVEAKTSETNFLGVVWITSPTKPDVSAALDASLNVLRTKFNKYSFINEQVKTTTLNGHEAKTILYKITFSGSDLYGSYSYWYCDQGKILYSFYFLGEAKDNAGVLKGYLDSFVCHLN